MKRNYVTIFKYIIYVILLFILAVIIGYVISRVHTHLNSKKSMNDNNITYEQSSTLEKVPLLTLPMLKAGDS